jgi:hypothetical protein
MVEPGDIGAADIGNALAAKHWEDDVLDQAPIFARRSRLPLGLDVLGEKKDRQLGNRQCFLSRASLRGRIATGRDNA